MGLSAEDGLYFASMIPSDRGFVRSLKECYYGNEDKELKPIKDFVEEMDANPEVWKIAQRIEGIINRRGVHPAGIAIFNNGDVFTQTSTMVAPGGQKTTQQDLNSVEQMGVVKYDLLATDAVDGIHTNMLLLVENGYMDWESDLRTTYTKYLHPEVIDYDSKGMWEMAHNKEVISLFQLDSPVGEQAIEEVKPDTLAELGVINSVMRLMGSDGGEMPLIQYKHRKENIDLWYQEMAREGLNKEEISILEKHVKDTMGMCITQEQLMLITQDPNISNFTYLESDVARKVISKKAMKKIAALEGKFFEAGKKCGASENLTNYVWHNLFKLQLGYA